MKHVIIGNGVAGTTAAQHIRRTDPRASISVITDEAYPFYSRIRLPRMLADETDEAGLVIHKPDWYAANRIDLFLSTIVTAVDPLHKKVITSSHGEFPYDRLLLATGAHCFMPPVPGSDRQGVFTLRNISDARKITDYVRNTSKRVLLIGGGVLGIEAGFGLMKAGCNITVVEVFSRLIPKQLDTAGAELLQSRLEELGFSFNLGMTVKEIQGSERVHAVLLADGRQADCDLVIISAGIRMNLAIPQQLGMTVDKGLVVNDRMETSIPDIYAAGDVAQHKGLCYGIWPAAEQQGEVAGINMAGGNAEYRGTTMSNTLSVAGIDIFSAGDIDPDGKKEAIVLDDPADRTYRKLVIEDKIITGAILLGDMRARLKIMHAMDTRSDISGIRMKLEAGDFSPL